MIKRLRILLERLLRRKFVQDTLALQIGKGGNAAISLVASVLIARLMGPTVFGEWALTVSFIAIWSAFNLTGVGPSTVTKLSAAIGARNDGEILNLMSFFIKMSLIWALPFIVFLFSAGIPVASYFYSHPVSFGGLAGLPVTLEQPYPGIGVAAAVFALVLIPDTFYNLIITVLTSRRSMRLLAVFQNVNNFTQSACVITALLVSPTLAGMVAGRIVYSLITAGMALWLYARERERGAVPLPSMSQVLAHVRRVPLRPYWRFGLSIALDRNLATLFLQIPMQIVGITAGAAAAGYLQLAIKAIQVPNNFTSAVFDNLQSAAPQAVGKGEYTRLRRNMRQVLLVMLVGAVGFYALFALAVLLVGDWLIPLVYGAEWAPTVPLLVLLAVFGAVTTVGGLFGPLYRALEMVRVAMLCKVIALALGLLPGVWLAQQAGAQGGALMISLLFTLSVSLTALTTLWVLNRRAQLSSGALGLAQG